MTQHLAILKKLLTDKKLTQGKIAKLLGYDSPSAVGMMLRGERSMSREVLEKLCDLAGVTVVSLAAMAGDLRVMNNPQAVEGAAILDDMTPEELAAIMPLLRSYRKPKADS